MKKYIIVASSLLTVSIVVIFIVVNNYKTKPNNPPLAKSTSSSHSQSPARTPKQPEIPSNNSSTKPKESQMLHASGTDYQVNVIGGMCGPAGDATPIQQICDQSRALDIVASLPNLNNARLVTAETENNHWKIEVEKQDVNYTAFLSHLNDTAMLVKITRGGDTSYYTLKLPPDGKASASTDQHQLTLQEGLNLIQKAGGDVPTDDIKIIATHADGITIGGGKGAKGYNKITLTLGNDNNVAIHEEYGTLDGGSYQPITGMPPQDFTVKR